VKKEMKPQTPAFKPKVIATESQEQAALFVWVKYNISRYPELVLLYHVANERQCSISTGAKLKRLGVKPGVPDLVLPVARGLYHGLYIEMKAIGKTPSDNQKAWLSWLNEQGYYAVVCEGWYAAAETITKYLKD